MKHLIASALIGLLPLSVGATAIEEAPWAPRAAAYRLSLFMANLTPVPWEKIENNWTAPAPGSAVAVEALSRVSDSDAQNIRAALAAEDRQALFAAITTALAKGILQHLEAAEATLGQPEAAFEVAQSAALYRAFLPLHIRWHFALHVLRQLGNFGAT